MKKNQNLLKCSIPFLCLMLFFMRPAYAYIDPGAGSIVLQLIIAGIVGALFAVKVFLKNILNFFKNVLSKKIKGKK